jgi:hypothetical protein
VILPTRIVSMIPITALPNNGCQEENGLGLTTVVDTGLENWKLIPWTADWEVEALVVVVLMRVVRASRLTALGDVIVRGVGCSRDLAGAVRVAATAGRGLPSLQPWESRGQEEQERQNSNGELHGGIVQLGRD